MPPAWDIKYLGMQILVEGLAMLDESRHVAFGVLSLEDYYVAMPASELRDREDFVVEACELMGDRLVGEETADDFGLERASRIDSACSLRRSCSSSGCSSSRGSSPTCAGSAWPEAADPDWGRGLDSRGARPRRH